MGLDVVKGDKKTDAGSVLRIFGSGFDYSENDLDALIMKMKSGEVETAYAYGKPIHRKQATWRLPETVGYGFGQANTNFALPEEQWPALCRHAIEWVRNVDPHARHNAVHVNLYPIEVQGRRVASGVGAHADNEPELVKGSSIWSISAYKNKGDRRRFKILERDRKTAASEPIDLEDGDVLAMQGRFQEQYLHAVVGTKRAGAGVRINLTVRHLKERSPSPEL